MGTTAGTGPPAAPAPPRAAPPEAAPAPVTARGLLGRGAALVAAAGVTAYVGVVDPSAAGAYPTCPSRLVLGIDCPACGGLRGTHDLLNGDLGGALDHNLLLPLLLAAHAVAFALWLRPLAGRPPRWPSLPRGSLVALAAVAAVFTLLRNLPVAGLTYLGSGAGG